MVGRGAGAPQLVEVGGGFLTVSFSQKVEIERKYNVNSSMLAQ